MTASDCIQEEDPLASGSSREPEDDRAIAPRIGMHARVLPVSGSYDEYTSSVHRVKIQNLVQTYQFNSESAQCFVGIRDNVYSPFVDEISVDKSSEAFQHRVRCCLIASKSLSEFIPASNKAEIVRAFNKFLKNRHALLNFVLDQRQLEIPETTIKSSTKT
ncbi:MAG: hypothetical protein WCJ92_08185, partial [Alphaproteobacteria bacterium]